MEQLINIVRKTFHYIIIKLLKIKDKDENLENNKRKKRYLGGKNLNACGFLIRNHESEGNGWAFIKC